MNGNNHLSLIDQLFSPENTANVFSPESTANERVAKMMDGPCDVVFWTLQHQTPGSSPLDASHNARHLLLITEEAIRETPHSETIKVVGEKPLVPLITFLKHHKQ